MMSSTDICREITTSSAKATGGVMVPIPGVSDDIIYPSRPVQLSHLLISAQTDQFPKLQHSREYSRQHHRSGLLVDHWLVSLSLCCNSEALSPVVAVSINSMMDFS